MKRLKRYFFAFLVVFPIVLNATNPLFPGYFADPSIKKFGDTYYIYATTDGIKLASGEPQVWMSKDFVNWTSAKLDLRVPTGLNNCWAPDVHFVNGRYYYFMGNCEMGCNIYGYVSDSPLGPFVPINEGKPVIPAGTSKENLPALDAQYLVDDDGSVYAYFGTWCTSFGGMGVVKIDPNDMITIQKTGFIPIQQVPKAFEAAYPIKRNGKYFLMYSSGDCRLSSYAVHYSVSDSPFGPFVPGKNSPILVSSADGVVDGPGHHSVLKEGDDYYIVYHRHDNPHSTNGEFRQVCADKLIFTDSVTLAAVVPTQQGIGYLAKAEITAINLALVAKASASSTYRLKAQPTAYSHAGYDYTYSAQNVVDGSYGTMWKAPKAGAPQSLIIDLGKLIDLKQTRIRFEYPGWYYCYKIESSTDSLHWALVADRTQNRVCGSPMVDSFNRQARYLKITVTNTEKCGVIPAIWEVEVYDQTLSSVNFDNKPSSVAPVKIPAKSKLVTFDARKLPLGVFAKSVVNPGSLKGAFVAEGTPKVVKVDGVKAIELDGKSSIRLSKMMPEWQSWNAPFTVSAWVKNPEIGFGECIISWTSRENMLQGTYAALMYGTSNFGAVAHGDGAVDLPYKNIPSANQWHHIVLTFDGALENVYVDGQLNTQIPISLYAKNDVFRIGSSGEPTENLTGYVASAGFYDYCLSSDKVKQLYITTNPFPHKQNK
ncbi:MAG: hypothetical protein RIS29_2066 [Bacteroidota bacterium]|jgi:hypothetical protein